MCLQWYGIKTEHRVVVKKLKFVKMLYVPCVLVCALSGNQMATDFVGFIWLLLHSNFIFCQSHG